MKKIAYLLFLALGTSLFSQYMIVGKDSISLQDFKKDNLYGLQNAGVNKTIKSIQDFLLLQQLAEEKKADTLFYFRQRLAQKASELRDQYYFPAQMEQSLLEEYVNANKVERNVLFFSVQKAEGDKTDYRKVYNDIVSGKLKMEDAIKTYVKQPSEPLYIKPGIVSQHIYGELMNLQPGGYTKLYEDHQSVTFAKLLNTRPSLGYLVFGTLSYPNDAESAKKKGEIFSALQSGKKFNEVTAQFGTTESEKERGGAVFGSPTLPDVIYNALKNKKVGEYTEPVLYDGQYFIFYVYNIVPYQITEKNRDFFKKEMMNSNYADELHNRLIASLRNTPAYKETKDFDEIKKSYQAFQNFKNLNSILYSYGKHQFTFGALKKEISDRAEMAKLPPASWKELMEMRRDGFVLNSYSKDFQNKPEVKKPIDAERKMIFSEYIFSEYLKKEITNNPKWLTDYYNQNKSKYIWEERAQGRVAIVADEKLVSEVQKQIKDIKNWEVLKKKYDNQLNAKNQILVHFEEGKMSKDADVFMKNGVPFKKGVYTTKIGDRNLVIALDDILPPTQMTEEEAKELLYDAVTEQKLQEIIAQQRAKTKIVVESAFIKDLEANFKK